MPLERGRASSPTVTPSGPALPLCSGEWWGQHCTAPGHQHGPRQQPRPGTSAWLLVVTPATDINRFQPLQGHGPRHGPGWQHGPGSYNGLRWQHRLLTSICSTTFHHTQTIPLKFLSHISTTYLHIIMALRNSWCFSGYIVCFLLNNKIL